MVSTAKVYQYDVGTVIRLLAFTEDDVAEYGIGLDGASKIEIHVTYPTTHTTPASPLCDCSCDVIWDATQYGTTQYVTYTTVDGDLDQTGAYILQTYVEYGDASKHHGKTYRLIVNPLRT